MQRYAHPGGPVRFVDLGPGRAEGAPSFGGSFARPAPTITAAPLTVEHKAKIAASLIARNAVARAVREAA